MIADLRATLLGAHDKYELLSDDYEALNMALSDGWRAEASSAMTEVGSDLQQRSAVGDAGAATPAKSALSNGKTRLFDPPPFKATTWTRVGRLACVWRAHSKYLGPDSTRCIRFDPLLRQLLVFYTLKELAPDADPKLKERIDILTERIGEILKILLHDEKAKEAKSDLWRELHFRTGWEDTGSFLCAGIKMRDIPEL